MGDLEDQGARSIYQKVEDRRQECIERAARESRETRRHRLELGATAFVALGFLISCLSLLLNLDQLSLMQTQFEQTKRESRPWIGINETEIDTAGLPALPAGISTINVRVELINAGKSPALIIASRKGVQLTAKLTEPLTYGYDKSTKPPSHISVLVPGAVQQEMVTDYKVPLSPEDAEAMSKGQLGLYYYGEVWYTEPSQMERIYSTKYCLVYFSKNRFFNCDLHNTAD